MLEIVNRTIDQFNSDLTRILKEKYVDIIIYGSNSINSFVPYQGDIDFIVALNENLDENDINKIFELHEFYRGKNLPNLEYQLEGVYYPIRVLENIKNNFIGCYIGTSRKGWKKIEKFVNNVFDIIQIRDNGLYYKNTSILIYEPSNYEIMEYLFHEINKNKKFIEDNIIPEYVVVQFVARSIYYLKNRKIGSKKESCEEYGKNHKNREYIQECGSVYIPDNIEKIKRKFPKSREIALETLLELKGMVEKDPNFT
jgi:hypothetical protein